MTFRFKDEVITPIGIGHLLIESWSHPGEHHSIDVEEMTCSCRGFQCRKKCRHLEKVRDLLKWLTTSPSPPDSSA
jgi:hypothetical protein